MSAYVSVDLQRRVRERFANGCACCRTVEALTATVFEFEHIVPRSSGGATSFENVALACPMCNRYKSVFSSATDPLTNTEVPLFHPQNDRWGQHFAWSEDGTELIGLTAIGRATITALKINRPAMIRVRRMWVAMGEHPVELDEDRPTR